MDDPTAPSSDESVTPRAPSDAPATSSLPETAYEETPVIEPVPPQEAAEVPVSALPVDEQPPAIVTEPQHEPATPPPPPSPRKKSGFLGFIGNLILFAALFGVGVWLSTMLRPYFSPGAVTTLPSPTPTPYTLESPTPTPWFSEENQATPTPRLTPKPTTTQNDWMLYSVLNGKTKKPVGGIQFSLPKSVLAPICDGTGCGSQGTFLPGKTRFTVAPRGKDQVLADFRGSIVSDLRGQAFSVKETTIAGKKAVEFSASFTGSTVEGYGFSQMRGVMIEVNAEVSLELNHFSPNGTTTDFAADDLLFDQIIKTLVLSATPAGVTPTAVPTATSSGL